MRTSILAVFFERHSRWIRSDVLSIRRAEKEWMAGRLPVQSLRVSTSSLACFCHKLLFGRGLICPSSPCSELCRPSSNLQHQTQDACTNSTLSQVRATQDTGGGCVFFFRVCELYQSSPRDTLRIGTSSAGLFRCHNLGCLVAESLHASTASKGFWLYNLEAEFSSIKDTEGKSSSFCSRQWSLFVDTLQNLNDGLSTLLQKCHCKE